MTPTKHNIITKEAARVLFNKVQRLRAFLARSPLE
jgi:hypothetical protein